MLGRELCGDETLVQVGVRDERIPLVFVEGSEWVMG